MKKNHTSKSLLFKYKKLQVTEFPFEKPIYSESIVHFNGLKNYKLICFKKKSYKSKYHR